MTSNDQLAGERNGTGTTVKQSPQLQAIIVWSMAALILVPSMLGFAAKFVEFIHTFQSRADGAFAITPVLNYLLASLGFFFLLVWATANGMFHDIERPKYRMLELEQELDKELQGTTDDRTERRDGRI